MAVAVLPWLFSLTRDDSNSVLEVVKDTHVCAYFSDSYHYTRVYSRRVSHAKKTEIIALWEAMSPGIGHPMLSVRRIGTGKAVIGMNGQIANV